MRFDEFEQRLNLLLDERLGWESDPEIAQWVRESAEHRAIAMSYLEAIDPKTLSRIDPLPACRPPADLAARVMAELSSDRQPAQLAGRVLSGSWLSSWSSLLALAAAVLIAVGWYVLRPAPTPDGAQIAGAGKSHKTLPPVATPENPPESAPVPQSPAVDVESVATDRPAADPAPEAHDPTIGALATEARDKYAELARDTQKAMSEVAMLLPGFGGPVRHRRGAAADEALPVAEQGEHENSVDGRNDAALGFGNRAGQRSDDWAGHVGDGLEPITRSAVGALDFILQALPVESPAGSPGADKSLSEPATPSS